MARAPSAPRRGRLLLRTPRRPLPGSLPRRRDRAIENRGRGRENSPRGARREQPAAAKAPYGRRAGRRRQGALGEGGAGAGLQPWGRGLPAGRGRGPEAEARGRGRGGVRGRGQRQGRKAGLARGGRRRLPAGPVAGTTGTGGRGPGPESGALRPAASRGSGRSRRPQPRALAGITRGTGEARVGGDDDALASLRADWAGDVGGRGLQGGTRGPSAEATPPQPRLSVPTAPRHRLPGRSTQTWTIPGGRGFGHHVNGTKATTAPPAHSSAPRAPLVSSVRSERKAALARFPARGAGPRSRGPGG